MATCVCVCTRVGVERNTRDFVVPDRCFSLKISCRDVHIKAIVERKEPTMFEEASEVFDNMFKGSFPLTFIVFIPAVLILVSPLPIEAAHEFTVYRMQQYDLQGQAYGEYPALCLPRPLLFSPMQKGKIKTRAQVEDGATSDDKSPQLRG